MIATSYGLGEWVDVMFVITEDRRWYTVELWSVYICRHVSCDPHQH